MNKNVNIKIKARRKELGLSKEDVALGLGITYEWVRDLEWYADEITTTLELHEAIKLCTVLRIGFFKLFDLQCSFCDKGEKYFGYYQYPRNKILHKKRVETGVSTEKLAAKIQWDESAIYELENDPAILDQWVIEDIEELAKELNVPSQILLGVKCPKCGR